MPRYCFNVCDGSASFDKHAAELPDLDAARREAFKHASTILDYQLENRKSQEAWWLEVTDHAGLVLLRIDFVLTEAPAAG